MRFIVFCLTAIVLLAQASAAQEPIVVLDYSQQRGGTGMSGAAVDHPFRIDPDFTQTHKVMTDETLGHIIATYYHGSGLNMKFVEMAIVQLNNHAFVRGNPHFMYADKTLHLPSVNEMQALVVGAKRSAEKAVQGNQRRDEIFFFGG
jgi:Tfp pilus assembly protein FimV